MSDKNTLKLKKGKTQPHDELIFDLIRMGYERVDNSLSNGGFMVLGGNIYVFPIDQLYPINIDFFGNQIENIFSYDQQSKKKIESYEEFILLPNILQLPDGSKIKPNDYVVHEDHGIGIFSGISTKEIEGREQVYVDICYLNESILHLPFELIGKLSPYIGLGRKKPKLSRLGSGSWSKTYKKTYENILKLAKELLEIYAKREIVSRRGWIFNKEWDSEIKMTFGYKETFDQLAAIQDTLSDLTSTKPVDRLICGDVGFGKTEVAIRAITQAVSNNYQVALLVPTTILAEQHYITLKERFKNLPVNIEHLSRFVKSETQREITQKITNGKVDILVSTHRIFGEDIKFKNLGLLVIDEEQKFGVKDKEKLKKLRTNLNVISLTATPIPRTLFMALSGIRDLSQISTPPAGRKDILTEVKRFDEEIVRKYIDREINRNGQIYYLHNEVMTIEGKKNYLKRLLPKLRIEVAHGQMSETRLAKVMSDFTEHKIDILVCSTIIENGLDLPNVNTIIVEDADKFGLSQLYQIRGRIGRSKQQAYALFTHPDKKITNNAFKRLRALVENTELGSGYNIALSDLEIRGGGNILGKEQHGSMEAVGLVLYGKLLKKAVEKLKQN